MAPPTLRPARQRPAAALLALDLVAVLAFAMIGRASHAEGVAIVGILQTAAPFLVGALVGALLSCSWREPLAWRSGVITWVSAVAVGLTLRTTDGGPLPLSFAVVTTISLAVLVLGWRAAFRLVATVRARRRA